jgi:hypothetical protein
VGQARHPSQAVRQGGARGVPRLPDRVVRGAVHGAARPADGARCAGAAGHPRRPAGPVRARRLRRRHRAARLVPPRHRPHRLRAAGRGGPPRRRARHRPLLPEDFRSRLHGVEYHTALCLLLELDRQLSPFYWTNVADPALPFVGVVEHANLVPVERYDGRRFCYVANYVEPGSPLLELDADALLAAYEPGLRAVNPGFDRSWVRQRWRFAEAAGQPVVDVGYPARIPPFDTGVPGLVLANTTQIYPEDRGTNYAVREGEQAAALLLRQAVGTA